MNRKKYILGLSFKEGILDTFGLASAYCFCLTPSQTCDSLLECGISRVDLRDSVLRKVCADVDSSYSDCHSKLIKNLLRQFMEVDSRGRQSLGYCLATIADHVPVADRRVIQEHFLASEYISVRRRGYKSVSHDEDLPQNLLLNVWKRFADPECGWLIIKMFPVEFLVEHRQTLRSTCSEGWQLARLYLRIGQVKPHLLKELKASDQISYCYVLAKLGRELTLKEAIAIIDGNAQDERFGLLVWALGRLRLWQALEYVESQLPAIEEIKLANMRTKYGI